MNSASPVVHGSHNCLAQQDQTSSVGCERMHDRRRVWLCCEYSKRPRSSMKDHIGTLERPVLHCNG